VEELIKKVSEKAGINTDQAKNAVNTVMEFIKNKVPGNGDQLKAMLSGEGGGGGIVENIRKKIGV
jgi:nucleoid DNA-binding protein